MAIVILGGLITATLLNPFVLPLLYLRFGQPSQLGGRLTGEPHVEVLPAARPPGPATGRPRTGADQPHRQGQRHYMSTSPANPY